MSSQLDRWQGEFGRAYTDRNQVDWHTRVGALKRIIPRDVSSVLEVGANRGHNLVALKSLGLDARGCEPADYARAEAVNQGLLVCACSVYDLYDGGHTSDLVMTCGVLTHVPPARLDDALGRIVDVARRYVLAIEYDGNDESIEYRGHQDMLWKRDYGKHYRRLFPELRVVQEGVLASEFDGAAYWLLQK